MIAELAGVGCARVAPALDELVAIRLLEPDAAVRFRHPLLRAAVVSTLGPSELAASHRRAAAALAGAGDDAVLPHLMASAGADDADVADALRRAAAAAVARGAGHRRRDPAAGPGRTAAGRAARRRPAGARGGGAACGRSDRGGPSRGRGGRAARSGHPGVGDPSAGPCPAAPR